MSRLSALLETIDPATQSWLERKRFEITDLAAFAAGLSLDEMELGYVYELTPDDMIFIEKEHGIAFDDKSLDVVICISHVVASRRYDELVSHTGRELLLMLQGKKPFAHFARLNHPTEEGIIPEALFEPHVQSGRFVKVVDMIGMTGHGAYTRIYYAVANEAWRIEAYRSLWHLAGKHGWNEGFEQMEGFLLGYETGIDPFFASS